MSASPTAPGSDVRGPGPAQQGGDGAAGSVTSLKPQRPRGKDPGPCERSEWAATLSLRPGKQPHRRHLSAPRKAEWEGGCSARRNEQPPERGHCKHLSQSTPRQRPLAPRPSQEPGLPLPPLLPLLSAAHVLGRRLSLNAAAVTAVGGGNKTGESVLVRIHQRAQLRDTWGHPPLPACRCASGPGFACMAPWSPLR